MYDYDEFMSFWRILINLKCLRNPRIYSGGMQRARTPCYGEHYEEKDC